MRRSVRLYVHELRFADTSELMRSFQELLQYESIEDCLVEPETLRIRFCSPGGRADRILERIYLHGGLTWCSRHQVR